MGSFRQQSAAEGFRAYHPLVRAVARALRSRCRVRPGASLLVAVSGGPDSAALLRALATLAPRRGWRLTLTVGHVQHHLRDEAGEAERDAQFVEKLAGELGLAYERADLTRGEIEQLAGGNIEAGARQARYRALEAMAAAAGAAAIATAHHGDDQLETLLMRLLRGAGARGMRGIAWRRRGPALIDPEIRIIRPMLGASRAQVIDYLDQLGQRYCTDATNAELSRTRARLRQEVTPVLRAIQPQAPGQAVAMAEHFREVHRLIQSQVALAADRALPTERGWELDRVWLRELPSLVRRGLLRRLLAQAGVPEDRLSRRLIESIDRAAGDREGGRRRFETAGGVAVLVERGAVRIER